MPKMSLCRLSVIQAIYSKAVNVGRRQLSWFLEDVLLLVHVGKDTLPWALL